MAGNFKPPVREKNFLDHSKLKLVCPNSKGKYSSLSFQITEAGNPRIVVYTNDPEDTADYGKITANMEPKTFFALLDLIKTAIDAPGKFREKIDNKHNWVGGQRTDKPQVVNSTIVSKDDEGVISIMISAPRRPNLAFPFQEDQYHNFVKNDGTPLTKGEASGRMARAWVKMLENVATLMMVINYKHPEKKDAPGGQGGGNRGGGGGGYQQRGGGGNAEAGASSGGTADLDELAGW